MKKVILLGRPNVGKSSLFNRLARARIAITSEVAGTTRDVNKTEINIDDRECLLIDSGGLDESSKLFAAVQKRSLAEANEADIIIFMVDGKLYADEIDKKLFYAINRLGKPTALVVNKVDGKRDEQRAKDFISFGAKKLFEISVSHNSGTDELCEWIYSQLEPAKTSIDESIEDFLADFDESLLESDEGNSRFKSNIDYENKAIKVGIIGRVNVGKSSLLNALVGQNRSVVSDIAGTTIDPVNEKISVNDGNKEREIEFIDTAGIRRRGKIEGIEKYALNRTQKMLEKADIAVLVLDSVEGINELDERIAGLASQFELGVIIVLNKWDLKAQEYQDFDKEFDRMSREIRDRFKFLAYAPIISLSATSKKRVEKLKELICAVYKNYTIKLPTSRLNEVIAAATKAHPIPREHGRAVRIYYAAQFDTAAPKIALVMNKPKCLHFSYLRYLQNQLRASFELGGTPVILVPRGRGKSKEENNE
ncbi:MAG: ribosome biogenesis GTPase Der [Campylobacter sp.]|uniref:ribosome biogenesis GTPase Der n=1 Tax=Campylobacter sp. TaxID=205 RepID=UPI0029782EDE|nr:ribosome biogenesis GTPase Der [Campylobacter sp.]MDD7600926.1 ribosome biogenesis GTPase Der [Campylobacteraceae bacterium]MDY5886867.1 ribosome biogenesis GTPase Der [Campylobacter sp.]